EDYFAHFSQIKMEGFKRLSGKQPVQFEVGADENGREIAVNIVPLTTGEEA
ncbi:cold-shock protein, partial [Blautia faecis]